MKRSYISRGTKQMKRTQMMRRRNVLRVKSDPKMVAWSKAVLERDDHHCQWPECPEQGPHVVAHHVHTKRQRPDLRYELNNGKAICFRHHDALHHTVAGRRQARELGLLGTETYEKSRKDLAA